MPVLLVGSGRMPLLLFENLGGWPKRNLAIAAVVIYTYVHHEPRDDHRERAEARAVGKGPGRDAGRGPETRVFRHRGDPGQHPGRDDPEHPAEGGKGGEIALIYQSSAFSGQLSAVSNQYLNAES
jgi:hypothetical protein